MEKNNKLVIIALGVLIFGLISFATYFSFNSDSKDAASTASVTLNQENNNLSGDTSITEEKSEEYNDGQYSSQGSYQSPAGEESIDLNITIENGLVTEAVFLGKGENAVSKKWQKVFTDNYRDYVVGKPINEVKIDKVAGSSLTPKGFNDAFNKIKVQAKS